ncbi:MAG: hypothetical protein QXX94_04165 [Candidatus Bathyarchaeia archaeon]
MLRVGSIRLVAYKRIGRVYSLEIFRKLLEELEVTHESKCED